MEHRVRNLPKERNPKDASLRIISWVSVAGLLYLLISRSYDTRTIDFILANHSVVGALLITLSILASVYGCKVLAEILMGLFLKCVPTDQRVRFALLALRYGGAMLSAGIIILVDSGIATILCGVMLSLLLIFPFLSRVQIYARHLKRYRTSGPIHRTELTMHYLGAFVMGISFIAAISILYVLYGMKSYADILVPALLAYALDSMWYVFFAPHAYQ